jgi:hypothetical protein
MLDRPDNVMKSGPFTGAETHQQIAIILRQSVDVNQRSW